MPDPFLPYGRQWVDEEDVQEVLSVLRGDFLTTGPMVERFEASLVEATGARRVLTVNSGTAALHAAYFAGGLRAGDTLLTSPLTFAATANAALYLGAKVEFCDVEADTGNLDPVALKEHLDGSQRMIAPIDFTGHPADYDAILPLATRFGAKVVADAAHSLGAAYQGRPVGTLAPLTATSFHPVKPITTGEGGAVMCMDPEEAERVASFRSHGITRDPLRMEKQEGAWYYEMQALGFNYRLTDIQCALGLSQLKRLGAFIQRRRAIAARYLGALGEIEALELPTVRPGVEPGWHLFVLRVRGGAAFRKPFFDRLRTLGLGVQIHYLPVYLHPYYRDLGYRKGLCPIAEDFYERSVSIPIFPRMTDPEVDRVIATIRKVALEVL